MNTDEPTIRGAVLMDKERSSSKLITVRSAPGRLLIHHAGTESANKAHDGAFVAVELVNGRFVVTVYTDACEGTLVSASRAANV